MESGDAPQKDLWELDPCGVNTGIFITMILGVARQECILNRKWNEVELNANTSWWVVLNLQKQKRCPEVYRLIILTELYEICEPH